LTDPSFSLQFFVRFFPHKEFENDVLKMGTLVLYSTKISIFVNRCKCSNGRTIVK